MSERHLPHDHGPDMQQLLQNMPGTEAFIDAADSFAQLCDGSRLRILWLLCHTEQCVSNIAAAVELSDAAASHHLRNLRQNGLLRSRRVGKEVHYTLADTQKAQLMHRVIDDYFQMSCPGTGA